MSCFVMVRSRRRPPNHCAVVLFVTLDAPFDTPDPPAPAKAGDPGSIPDSRHRRSRCRAGRTAGACSGPRSEAAERAEAGPRIKSGATGGNMRRDSGRAARRPPAACHEMSCFVMRARRRPLSGRPVGLLLCASCMRFLLRVSFRPRSRPPGRGADPVSRVSRARLRPGAGGRFAAARFARLIARVRRGRRTHLSRRFLRVLFSRRRETEREAAPRGHRLPFLTHCSTLI